MAPRSRRRPLDRLSLRYRRLASRTTSSSPVEGSQDLWPLVESLPSEVFPLPRAGRRLGGWGVGTPVGAWDRGIEMRIHFYADCANVEDEDVDRWDLGPHGDMVTCVLCLREMITEKVLIVH